jgi:hypothetical protein
MADFEVAVDDSILVHGFEYHRHPYDDAFDDVVLVIDISEVPDERLQGASLTVFHDHVDEVVVGMGFVEVNKIVGGNLFEFEKDFSFDEGFMHFVDLRYGWGLTLMICFLEIFFIANWSTPRCTRRIYPKDPFPMHFSIL